MSWSGARPIRLFIPNAFHSLEGFSNMALSKMQAWLPSLCLLCVVTMASAQDLSLRNGDFQQAMVGNSVPGWRLEQHAGDPAYEMKVVPDKSEPGNSILHTTDKERGLRPDRARDAFDQHSDGKRSRVACPHEDESSGARWLGTDARHDRQGSSYFADVHPQASPFFSSFGRSRLANRQRSYSDSR